MEDFQFLHNEYDGKANQTMAPKVQVILVEDDALLGHSLKGYLEKNLNLSILYYSNPGECLQELNLLEGKSCILITDISFDESGTDGLFLIDTFREKKLNFSSIVMTGFGSIQGAINATKKGVYHYLTKPFDPEVLQSLILKAIEEKFNISSEHFLKEKLIKKNQLERANSFNKCRYKVEAPSEEDLFQKIVGRSVEMKDVFKKIEKVAQSDSTVLITGPSGTGKELVAKAIHRLSKRRNANLISVNCGAIPSELLESELFGHVKGSFTGAISDKKGRFEMANGGSIFLDEIGDMPFLLQVKILRVLQNREIERVGEGVPRPIDVRIITATHRDLEKAVIEGNFREDLYYRLNVIPIKIPPLSRRKEDVPLLISYFLDRYASADGRNRIDFCDEALELLLNYNWPGNVRELENLIERLVILKGGSLIKIDDLPEKFFKLNSCEAQESPVLKLPDDGIDLKHFLNELENSLIDQALNRTNGNKNQASKLLQLNRTTLIEKLKKKEKFNELI